MERVFNNSKSEPGFEGTLRFKLMPIALTFEASSLSIALFSKSRPLFSKSLIGIPFCLSKNCVLSSIRIKTISFVFVFAALSQLLVFRPFIVSSSSGHHKFLSTFSRIIARTKPKTIPKRVFFVGCFLFMTFIDSHCHIILEVFDNDRDNVIQEALSSGITHIVQSCDNLDEIKKNLVLTKKYPDLYSSVGIHPHEAKLWDKVSKDTIKEYTKEKKVIAIGETGLDFYYNYSPKEIQLEVFKEHIKIANEVSLPLIIHCRDAFNELVEILKNEKPLCGGVFHCFTGSLKAAREAINLGFYISWSGILTFKNANDLKEVAKEIPLENTLIETDCPFLAPIPNRGKRNEPKYVKYVAEELARIKSVSIEEIGEITSENTKRLFGIA